MTDDDNFMPWITDPDDPADHPTADDDAADKVAAMFPELIDKSKDGPLKDAVAELTKAIHDTVVVDPRSTQHIIRTFFEAINHLDESEPQIRDMIESDLMDVAGINRMKASEAMLAAKTLTDKIVALRTQYIKRAFRHLRDRLPSDL